MARVTREERKKRRISALSRLQDGWGTGETIQYLMRDYGLTRRSANLDVVWANKELEKEKSPNKQTAKTFNALQHEEKRLAM